MFNVTGHTLHSFCARDHDFKGIIGIFLIKLNLHIIPFHGTLTQYIRFFLYKLHFVEILIKLQHQRLKQKNTHKTF